MAMNANQKDVPLGSDQFAYKNQLNALANSVTDVVYFQTLGEATTWATTNPTLAVNGRLCWIHADNAFYVRLNSAWVRQSLLTRPVGTIEITTTATNPGTYLGGTWAAWGAGRVPVGVGNNGSTNYTAVEAVGGADTVRLSASQSGLRDHGHHVGVTSQASGFVPEVHMGQQPGGSLTGLGWSTEPSSSTSGNRTRRWIAGNQGASDAIDSHENRMPYITCYLWKRTA